MVEETGASAPAAVPTPKQVFVQSEDFGSVYSNNVQFESFPADLNIIFGESRILDGKPITEQHTAVRMTWAQAKLLAFFLTVQIDIYEFEHGKISIPKPMLPPVMTMTEEYKIFPKAQVVIDFINKLRDKFLADLEA